MKKTSTDQSCQRS